MKFLTLSIKNFLTIGNAEINLNDRGLLLVQGVNTDDSSANSNGSGKSSITDALCWCLYGKTARDVSGDDVINHSAKKDCEVTIVIQDGSNKYRISRYRKHSDFGSTILAELIIDDEVVSLTKGTMKDTQDVVDRIVGCSHEVFTASIYAGQEKMPDLPAMSESQLKTLIEEASGIKILDEANAVAREKYKKVIAMRDEVKQECVRYQYVKEDREALLSATKGQQEDFLTNKDLRVKKKLSEALSEKFKLKELNVIIEHTNIEALESERKELKSTLRKRHEATKALSDLSKQVLTASKALNKAENAFNSEKKQLVKLIDEIKQIKETVGTNCTSCGKEICEHDVEAVKQAKTEQAKTIKAGLVELEKNVLAEKAKLTEIENEYENTRDTVGDFSELEVRLEYLEKEIQAYEVAKSKIDNIHANIENIKKQALEMKMESDPYESQVQSFQQEVIALTEKLNELNEKLNKLNEQVDIAENVVFVFGQKGVRSHILDTVTPYLNERTAQYLGALSDGNISAQWTTLTKNSKGEIKDKFSIIVKNDKGANSFNGLSGGEKRKVRLATCMALQDLVSSRAIKPIDLFIADEIDDALDTAGIERLMTVLNQKARDKGTVLVISHNDLKDEIDLVITVSKNGGYSTVSGDV